MKSTLARSAAATVLVVAAMTIPASAQNGGPVPSVTVPTEGRFALGGEFTGSATVNRFEQRGNSIVAIGFVKGTLRRGNRAVGTVVAGEVTWPVLLRVNGVIASASADAPPAARMMPAGLVLAQAEPCPVLQVGLGAININLLGVNVALSPIALNLSGDAAGPLGALVCEVLDLVGNVVGLVDLLNGILGLITGLLGGLLP
jgi:energy-converting hydrogenase Eha subunit A